MDFINFLKSHFGTWLYLAQNVPNARYIQPCKVRMRVQKDDSEASYATRHQRQAPFLYYTAFFKVRYQLAIYIYF